jgi:hypothetical protein
MTQDNHQRGEKPCDRWCKVHNYFDFNVGMHLSLPTTHAFHSNTYGWVRNSVYSGPPGYYPKRPDVRQWDSIRRACPHRQTDLTCNNCLRHMFRPREL